MRVKKKKKIIKKKQNPEEIKPEIRQSSEFEKKEIIDTNEIAALIDKAKEIEAKTEQEEKKLTQSSVKNSFASGLSLSEEDASSALNAASHPSASIRIPVSFE